MPKMIKIGEIRVLNYFDLPWNEPVHLLGARLKKNILDVVISFPGKLHKQKIILQVQPAHAILLLPIAR